MSDAFGPPSDHALAADAAAAQAGAREAGASEAGDGAKGPHGQARSPEPDEAARVAALRAQLPATRAGIYLNTGTSGPLPAEVAAAIREVEDRELAVGRASREAYEDLLARMDEARSTFAAVLGTGIDAIALTHSTTEGMNLALGAIAWRPGDRVLTTNQEHPGLAAPLAALREGRGVDVEEVDIGDGGDDDATTAAFERALGRGGVRMVAFSHVTWSTGARLPAARIGALARASGALVAVDGAQAAGAIAVSFDDLGADFYATSGQKWLLGPEGTGALAVAPAVRDLLPPARGYFSAATPYQVDRASLWADARRYEIAGFHKPSIVGIARSAGWLAMYVGLPWAHERAARLAAWAAGRLAATPGVVLITPRSAMATLVTFRLPAWPAEAAADELGRRVFAILRTIPGLEALRLSIGFFTTEAELSRVLDAIAELARHTPATLPARPGIQFLDAAPG